MNYEIFVSENSQKPPVLRILQLYHFFVLIGKAYVKDHPPEKFHQLLNRLRALLLIVRQKHVTEGKNASFS